MSLARARHLIAKRQHLRGWLYAAASVAALSATVLGGCANPEGEYENFKDRYETINPPSTSSSGVGGGCMAPTAAEAEGDYLFSLSPAISPATPVVFLATVTATDGTDGLDMSFSLQPLSAVDRMTPVGAPLDFTTTADAMGTFMTAPADISIDGVASPFGDSTLVAEGVTLAGTICTPAESSCGAVGGDVTMPIPTPLMGSTFAMQRVTGPADYPEPPPINCAGDLAMGL